eukprot:snap_masked-scaffold_9-processed-gene-12.16-mRNA-1 protein AED:1.00 eAED:1.00 QI:0/-1/0/0/-1/1/1/0/229
MTEQNFNTNYAGKNPPVASKTPRVTLSSSLNLYTQIQDNSITNNFPKFRVSPDVVITSATTPTISEQNASHVKKKVEKRRGRAKRKKRSPWHDYFEASEKEEGIVLCKSCGEGVKHTTKTGTGGLRHHILKQCKNGLKVHNARILEDWEELTPTQRIGKTAYKGKDLTAAKRELLKTQVECMKKNKLPFSFFAKPEVVAMFQLFLPDYKGTSGDTLKLHSLSQDEKEKK